MSVSVLSTMLVVVVLLLLFVLLSLLLTVMFSYVVMLLVLQYVVVVCAAGVGYISCVVVVVAVDIMDCDIGVDVAVGFGVVVYGVVDVGAVVDAVLLSNVGIVIVVFNIAGIASGRTYVVDCICIGSDVRLVVVVADAGVVVVVVVVSSCCCC